MRFSEEKVTWSNDKSPWNCYNPVGISLFEVNSRNTKAICGIWSKLTSHLLLMLLLLTLTRYMPAGTKIMIIVMALAMMSLLTDLTSELIQFYFLKKLGAKGQVERGEGWEVKAKETQDPNITNIMVECTDWKKSYLQVLMVWYLLTKDWIAVLLQSWQPRTVHVTINGRPNDVLRINRMAEIPWSTGRYYLEGTLLQTVSGLKLINSNLKLWSIKVMIMLLLEKPENFDSIKIIRN